MSDLNKRAAKCLGWANLSTDPHEKFVYYVLPNDNIQYVSKSGNVFRFDPEHNRDQAAMLEAEIERREIKYAYILCLWNVCIDPAVEITSRWKDSQIAFYLDILWPIVTATPAQRTEAAVTVLEAQDETT